MNEGVLPVPLAASPIEGSEFTQAKVVPGVVLIYEETATVRVLHTVIFAGTTTTGVGFILIVKDTGVPGQPLAVGVTVTVDVIGLDVTFVPVNDGVLPVPLAASPIEGVEFVHAKVVPGVELVNTEAATETPLQTVMFAGTTTTGVGFIVIV